MSGTEAEQGILLSSLLPDEILGWKTEGEDESYDPQTIFDYINGAGEVYRSYNFRELLVRRFQKESRPDIVCDFFDMGTSADAFGVFTHDLEGEEVSIGCGATYKGGLLSFWKDRYFISLTAEEETPETREAIFALGRKIASEIKSEGEKPQILSLLPLPAINERNVRYFHNHIILNFHYFVAAENILFLGQETEAVLAALGEKSEREHLLIIRYPGDEGASQAYESFIEAYMPEARGHGIVQTEDGKWTAVKRVDRYLLIIFNASTSSSAEAEVERVIEKIKE